VYQNGANLFLKRVKDPFFELFNLKLISLFQNRSLKVIFMPC